LYVAENATDIKEDEEDDINYVEYIDPKGAKKLVSEDELFYVQSLLEKTGKEIDWDAFAKKNQMRIDRINEVDGNLEKEKQKQKDKDKVKAKELYKEEMQ
jgi:hypothetical protein